MGLDILTFEDNIVDEAPNTAVPCQVNCLAAVRLSPESDPTVDIRELSAYYAVLSAGGIGSSVQRRW